MPVSRLTQRIRAAVARNHVAAVAKGEKKAVGIDRQANAVKIRLRQLAADPDPRAAQKAEMLFRQLAAQLQIGIDAFLKAQAAQAAAQAVALIRPVAPPPPAAEVKEEEKPKDLLALALLLPFLFAGFAAARGGAKPGQPNAAGLAAIDSAVNGLASRAKGLVRYGVVNAATKATRKAVEAAVPVVFPPRPPLAKIPPPEFIPPGIIRPVPPPDEGSPREVTEYLIGWQVLSVLWPTTRHKHRERHKTIYYFHPGPKQLGLFDMPNPPFESARDGNALAPNCKCSLCPVFSRYPIQV